MNKLILLLLVLFAISSQASAQSMTLETDIENDSNGAETGLFFDLTATNDVSIESFGLYSDAEPAAPGSMDIYVRPGSYKGFENSPDGWTKIASFSFTNIDNELEQFVLPDVLGLPAGQTIGVYAYSEIGGIAFDDEFAEEVYSDTNLTLTTYWGSEEGPFSGSMDVYMSFAGTVTYGEGLPQSAPPTSIPTLSSYQMILMALGLLLIAFRRLHVSAKRG